MKKIKNMKIGKKLRISFAIVLILATLSSFYALYNLKQSQKLSQHLFEEPYVITSESMAICKDVSSIDGDIMGMVFTDNPMKYKTFAVADFNSIDTKIKTLHDCYEDKTKLDNLEISVVELRQEYEKIYAFIEQGDYKTAQEMATNSDSEYCKAYYKCAESSSKLNELAKSEGTKFNNDIQDTVSKARILSTALSVFSIVAGVVICGYITNDLTKRIRALVIMANKLAKGDFDF